MLAVPRQFAGALPVPRAQARAQEMPGRRRLSRPMARTRTHMPHGSRVHHGLWVVLSLQKPWQDGCRRWNHKPASTRSSGRIKPPLGQISSGNTVLAPSTRPVAQTRLVLCTIACPTTWSENPARHALLPSPHLTSPLPQYLRVDCALEGAPSKHRPIRL